jgi:hypothetical protein
MGYADLVTDCCVYEAKVALTTHRLKTAVGQALLYRDYIDRKRELGIVIVGGVADRTNEAVPYLANSGFSVLGWRPTVDILFTKNLTWLEGITPSQFKELSDQVLFRTESRGDVPLIASDLNVVWDGVSAIEHRENSPQVVAAKGNESLAIDRQMVVREKRQRLPRKEPQPLEGLPSPKRVPGR